MTVSLLPVFLACAAVGAPRAALAARVHMVTDLSHEFTFYFDGRFATNYLSPADGVEARSWGTLHKRDLSNANLLVLPCGASPCPYTPRDIEAVRRFLSGGGGVLLLGDFARFEDRTDVPLNRMARAVGAEFTEERAAEPLAAEPSLGLAAVRTYGGSTLRLAKPVLWRVLVRDAAGRPVLARRRMGRGAVAVASRALCGRQPDARDPINADLWKPLLRDLAAGKRVDPAKPFDTTMPENVEERDGLRIRFSDYLRPYADAVYGVYKEARPALETLLGVPPSPEMLTSLILLPTGGGGFSDGRNIGLGVWWGGFPRERYGMVELLGHEATHSWVLPFPEPMWNEGIATYAGIRLGQALGLAEADRSLAGWIEGAMKIDPGMARVDIAAEKGVPHAVAMAKPMWIFEQLRKEHPDILARYFRTKRALIDPARRQRYTADDSVAVLSLAAGRDLFEWFRSLGVSVDRARTDIAAP